MKLSNIAHSVALACICMTLSCLAAQAEFTRWVNPFCGTDAHGHTFPAATVPFGMVQLGPDTRVDGWDGCSGYHWSDSTILGFSHTHLSGTGCLDYGDILLMPVCEYSCSGLDSRAYGSSFSHGRESAAPGYYSVFLERSGILAELTAGERFGMHRYSYPKGAPRYLVIDLRHRDILLEAVLNREGACSMSGLRRSKSWSENHSVYFWADFSVPVKEFRMFGNEGALLRFEDGDGPVCIKLGLSSVSAENARENLAAEISTRDFGFDKVRKKADLKWEEFLSRIDLSGSSQWKSGDKKDKERLSTFYTALYHCGIAPNLMSDSCGEYRGMDGKVHRAEGFRRYTVFSLWDTFRALHPLLSIIERERSLDFLRSFLCIYDECGKLPVWELWGWETNCMIGYNSAPVIADALAKGLLKDTSLLLRLTDALVASSRDKAYGLGEYRLYGLVPGGLEHESVSKTLEYAFDDWCVALCASEVFKRTGEPRYRDTALEYFKSSLYWRNVFDPGTGFMRAGINGRWQSPFDPREVNNHFTEANSWQYSFFVPHDIGSHILMLGGDKAYAERLDGLFCADPHTKGRRQSDITGLIGQYAHGNEPSHHVAYLYNYAGQPWKTQERVREIMDSLYSPAPDGECGNDDCGQMSAWYVMSAMGLYQVTPGADRIDIGSPLFDRISLNRGRAVITTKTAAGNPAKKAGGIQQAPYVCGAELDGRKWNSLFIPTDKLLSKGFRFTFHLSDSPSSFGSDTAVRPHSVVDGASLVRNPVFVAAEEVFRDSVLVSIEADGADRVFFRIDDSPWSGYDGPFTVTRSCRLEAYALNAASQRSFVSSCSLRRKPMDKTIELHCRYNPQYDGGSSDALVDGVRGSAKWKTGHWQGFQAQDFEAVVDLLENKRINSVGAGFCQDARSWIWMPRYAKFHCSEDGVNWTLLGRADNRVDPQDYTVQTQDLEIAAPQGTLARYIRVFAKNFGTIPSWHLGAGGEAFIFVDEIVVR